MGFYFYLKDMKYKECIMQSEPCDMSRKCICLLRENIRGHKTKVVAKGKSQVREEERANFEQDSDS